MTKITLKVERHYGNKDLKAIIESLVSMKISNFESCGEAKDKSYNNIKTDVKAIPEEGNKL